MHQYIQFLFIFSQIQAIVKVTYGYRIWHKFYLIMIQLLQLQFKLNSYISSYII